MMFKKSNVLYFVCYDGEFHSLQDLPNALMGDVIITYHHQQHHHYYNLPTSFAEIVTVIVISQRITYIKV